MIHNIGTYLKIQLDDGHLAGLRYAVNLLAAGAVVDSISGTILNQAVTVTQLVEFLRLDKVVSFAIHLAIARLSCGVSYYLREHALVLLQ